MATTQIKIEAQVQQALQAIEGVKRALGSIDQSAGRVSDSMREIQKSTDLATTAFGALAAAISVREIVNLADAATLVSNKLRSVSPDAQTAAMAFQQVGRIAQTTGQNLEAVADLYQKVSLQSKELQLTQSEVARVTENFSKALVITGTTGQAAASAIYQFGQALGRGRVAYEDIRQLQEASSATVALIAKQFDMSGQQFVKAVQDGKISSEELALAVNNLGKDVGPTFDNMNKTVGQSLENIRTSFILMINNFEKSTGTFAGLAKILDLVAKNIDVVVVAASAFMAVFAAKKILDMAMAFRTLNSVMRANPLILIASVAAGLAATIYEMVGASKQLDEATGDILEKEETIRGVKDTQLDKTKELTKEQENALKALDNTIAQVQIQTQFQQDILKYGQQEAEVRRNIASEQQKLLNTNLNLSREEVVQRMRVYEANLRNQQSIQNQVTNQNELNRAILGMMTGLTSAGREMDKLETLMALRSGKTLKQIEEEKLARIQSNKVFQFGAIQAQKTAVEDAIRQEIYKFDRLKQLDQERELQMRRFTEIEMLLNKEQTANTLKLQEELNQARLQADRRYQLQKIEIERQTAEELRRIELERIQRSMMNEKDLGRVILSEKDRQILQEAGRMDRQRAIVEERIAFEKRSEMEKAQFAINQGAQMFSALGAQNKRAFEAAKAFNIANAIMNTYMAATKALATYPWPFGLVAAASAVGMGLAQVAQIRSQQYSGRQLGGPVMANKSYIVGENGPELFTPNNTGSITRNSDLGGGQPVNVTFNIVANDTAGFDDLLLSRRGMIRSIISDAMIESGRRG